MRLALALLLLAACGTPATHAPNATPPDASPDAPPDAPPVLPLVASPADLGLIEANVPTAGVVHVSNPAASAQPLPAVTFDGDLALRLVATSTCSPSLAAGASCDLVFVATAASLGDHAGALVLGDLVVPIHATGAGRVSVELGTSTATGHVTSSPAGIDCPGACTMLATAPVTLTVAPDPPNRFVGVELDAATPQVVPPSAARQTFHGTFLAPGFVAVTILSANEQLVEGGVFAGASTSAGFAPFVAAVPSGVDVGVHVTSPGAFEGLTGACTVAAYECDFTPTTDVTVTGHASSMGMTFTPVGPAPSNSRLTGFTVDSAGNVIVATSAGVEKLDPTATILLWSVPLASGGGIIGLADGDHVEGYDGTHAYRLAPDGTLEWIIATDVRFSDAIAHEPAVSVSPVDGDLAIDTTGQITVLDSTGATRWTFDVASSNDFIPEIGYDGAGVLHAFIADDSDASFLVRSFDTDGVSLGDTPFVYGGDWQDIELAVNAAGDVAMGQHDQELFFYGSPAPAPRHVLEVGNDTSNRGHMALAADGTLYWQHERFSDIGFFNDGGQLILEIDPSGAINRQLEHKTSALGQRPFGDRPYPVDIQVAPDGRVLAGMDFQGAVQETPLLFQLR